MIMVVGTPEYEIMNVRRAELIRKKNREGLNQNETNELKDLQEQSLEAIKRVWDNINYSIIPADFNEYLKRLNDEKDIH